MEIRPYTAGDEQAICGLFKLAFNKEMSLEYWNWRYRDNPTGMIMISLMWDGETLVGHYALSPVYLNLKGEKILSGLSMTTMTHPEYRGLGIFPTLAEHLYKEQALNGLKMVWGFPNNNSHYIFGKVLKWKDVEQIPTFSLFVEHFKMPAEATSVVSSAQFKESYLSVLADQNEELCQVHKSLDYLNWRYLKNPTADYQIFELEHKGKTYFAVTKVFPSFDVKGRYEIDVLELNFPDDYKSGVQLISAILENYKDFNPLKINMWMPLSSKKHLVFEKMGFGNVAPVTYLGFRSLEDNSKGAIPFTYWDYQMGDSDVY